jgi:hypothetical protein
VEHRANVRRFFFVLTEEVEMITIWGGYIAAGDARVYLITFDGERIGGVDERNARRTFYATADGRVVVHEVRVGKRRCGRTYDQALVYVFSSITEACAHLDVCPQHIAQTRGETTLPRVDAPTLTLEEWACGAGTY